MYENEKKINEKKLNVATTIAIVEETKWNSEKMEHRQIVQLTRHCIWCMLRILMPIASCSFTDDCN